MKYLLRLCGLVTVLLIVLTACNRDMGISTTSQSVTISEETINATWYEISSYPRVEDIEVDLQPNQVVIKGRLTPLGDMAYDAKITLTPIVMRGIVTWKDEEIMVEPFNPLAEQRTQVKTAFLDSWTNFVKSHYGEKWITAVTITDTEIIYSLGQ